MPVIPSYDTPDAESIEYIRKELQRLARENERLKHQKDEQVAAIYAAVRDGLAQIKIPASSPPKLDVRVGHEEVCVPVLSDLQLAKVTPTYNTAVCEARMEVYADKVIALTEVQRADHPIRQANIWLLGDIIEGCFSGETLVVTKRGLVPISELAAEGHGVVKSDYGEWIEAKFQSFGSQRLWKLDLSRANNRVHKTVYTTEGHRWLTLDNPSANSKKVEVFTRDLRVGDMFVSNFGRHPLNMSPIGVMAGFVFGDGNRNHAENREHGCSVNVYRQKWELLKFFEGHPMSAVQHGSYKAGFNSTKDSDFIKVSALPSFFNNAPNVGFESLSYLYGWAAGYFAADGTVKKYGTLSISSHIKENIEVFRDVCARIGIGTNPIRRETDNNGRDQYCMSLVAETVPVDFMVHPSKRDRLEACRKGSKLTVTQRNTHRNWKVVSCEPTDRIEEVFCAVVPDTHTFTIEGDILTGNSGIFPGQSYHVDAGFYRQVTVDGPRILASFFHRLLGHFETINVTGVIGNHGRMGSTARTEFDPESNGDRMLYRILALMFAHEPRISFNIPDGAGERNWYAIDTIGNYKSLLCHGDQFQSFGSLYSIGRKVLGWKAGAISEPWDDLFIGHFHQSTKITFGNTVMRVNGTTESTNTYAQEKLASLGVPSQHLMYVHPVRGMVTAEYDVFLGDV